MLPQFLSTTLSQNTKNLFSISSRKCRKQILFANTLFMCVKYYPSGVQILTCGSNRKIAYWEVFDGSLIREIDGSSSAGVNALDISPDGSMFVTGGNDQVIKVKYP